MRLLGVNESQHKSWKNVLSAAFWPLRLVDLWLLNDYKISFLVINESASQRVVPLRNTVNNGSGATFSTTRCIFSNESCNFIGFVQGCAAGLGFKAPNLRFRGSEFLSPDYMAWCRLPADRNAKANLYCHESRFRGSIVSLKNKSWFLLIS